MRRWETGLAIACVALCLCISAQAGTDPSMVLYLDFEDGEGDTVKDSSSLGNDGVIQGEGIWTEGKFGGGLELNTAGIVLVPDCDEFKITGAMTLACWAYFKAFAPDAWQGNTLDFLVCRWNWTGRDNRCYETYLKNHGPGMSLSSDGTDAGGAGIASEDAVELETWHNIVGVYDGSKIRIYLNGQEVASDDCNKEIFAGEGPMCIGDNDSGSATKYHFVGIIDEVAVYNRALSQGEIRQKMQLGHLAAVNHKGKLTTKWAEIRNQHRI